MKKLLLLSAALALLGMGCGRPAAPPASADDARPREVAEAPAAYAGVPEKCRTLLQGLHDRAGSMTALGASPAFPSDFPAPPSGSVLCGTVNSRKEALYLTDRPGAEISGYYKNFFSSKGYFVFDAPATGDVRQGVDKILTFTNETFSRSGITGTVVTSPQGFFIVGITK